MEGPFDSKGVTTYKVRTTTVEVRWNSKPRVYNPITGEVREDDQVFKDRLIYRVQKSQGYIRFSQKHKTDKKCLKVMTRFIIFFTTKHIVRLKYSFGNDTQCWDFITAWHPRNDCFLFYTCTLKKK